MAQVKGSVFAPWVIGVRSDKSGACKKFLTEDDLKIISGTILPSSWYPYETFKNVVNAVAKELAKNNMEIIRQWGHDFTDSTYKNIYKNLFSQKSAKEAMSSHRTIFNSLFDFLKVVLEKVSENEYIVKFEGIEPDFKAFVYGILGTFEKSLEYGGAKDLNAEIIEKGWEGAPVTSIRFTWSGWG